MKIVMKVLFTGLLGVFLSLSLFAQHEEAYQKVRDEVDAEALNALYEKLMREQREIERKIEEIRKREGESEVRRVTEDGEVIILAGFDERGFPIYYGTDNVDAAATTNTTPLQQGGSSGLNLTGNGIVVGEWDGGTVMDTHQEFGNRITVFDTNSSSSHATHVAGTIGGSGVNPSAKGMATGVDIWSWDFGGDTPDMASFAGNGDILSNHSYGTIAGWRQTGSDWRWYGDTTISATEDYKFGQYNFWARVWDTIANANPYYLMVKSAGNNRSTSGPPGPSFEHEVRDGNSWVTSFTNRGPNCPTGYDCLPTVSNAKNILTVAAVNDVTNYSGPGSVNMSSFSSWGPTDDGRIKPDISANGVGLFSADNGSSTDYSGKSGTSMSAPNVTGSIVLLQELHSGLYSSFMKSATVKALIIETAKPAGNGVEPDYEFGWGLMDAYAAAGVIQGSVNDTLVEETLNNADTVTFTVHSDGTTPLSATVAWNDPAGAATGAVLNDPTIKLVNDLDILITDANNNTYEPYILDPGNPSNSATTGNNIRDNVEKVYIAAPQAGTYTIRITHKGSLTGGSQDFSLAVTGKSLTPNSGGALNANIHMLDSGGCEGVTINFADVSSGVIQSRSWDFPGGNPAVSTDSSISVTYNQAGTYDVTLIVTDTSGASDTVLLTNAVTIDTVPFAEIIIGDTFCLNEPVFPVNVNPPGGSLTGNGISGPDFDAFDAGTGDHDIIYTVQNGVCAGSDTQTVHVLPLPGVSHPDQNPVCESAAPFAPAGANPSGGTYSGTGMSGGMFDPGTSGAGAFDIIYSFTDQDGCTASDTFTVTVDSLPQTSFPDSGSICENTPPFVVTTAQPQGGTYSGTAINTSGEFDPALAGTGTTPVFYEITNGACTSFDTADFTVVAAPSASLSLADTLYCESDPIDTLSGGTPAGGVFSGNGITSGIFDPAAAGVGFHAVTYTFTDLSGCSDSATQTVEVEACTPPLNFYSSDSSICAGDSIIFTHSVSDPFQSLEWIFDGGTPATTNDTNPVVSYDSAGSFDVTLIVTDTGGQMDTVTAAAFIAVNAVPNVSVSFWNTTCIDLGISPITHSPPGGVFSGSAGISGTNFTAANAGIGQHDIIYTVTNGGCTASDTHTTNVVDTPSVSHPDIQAICDGSTPFTPAGGSPSGGDFSGSGFFNNVFHPDSAGIGVHQIEYYYVDTNNCDNSDSFSIEVVPGGSAVLTDTFGICGNEGTFSLNTGSPSGGTYYGTGVDTTFGTFDPSVAGAGTFSYMYSVNLGACDAVDTGLIEVVEAPQVSLSQQAKVCAAADTVDLTGGSPQGGIYSGNNVVNNQFITSGGVGNYVIEYTFTDSVTGCTSSDTAVLEVVNSVQVSMRDSSGICSTSESFDLELGSPFGGIYSGPGIVNFGRKFKPENVGAGSYDIVYSYDTNGCSGADTATLTVIQGPQIVFQPPTQACISEDSIELTATPAGGTFSGNFVSGNVFLPSQAGFGNHNVTYSYTDAATGCFDAVTATVEVSDGGAQISIPQDEFCENDNPVTLSGNPVPGVFAGTGVSGVSFDPDDANAGLHRVEYRTLQGCLDTAEIWVRVHPTPFIGSIFGAEKAANFNTYTYSVQAQSGQTYDWNVSGGTIVTDNNGVISVEWGSGSIGEVSVYQTNQFGCSDTVTLQVFLAPLSVIEAEYVQNLTIYPNPASNELVIEGRISQNRTLDYRLTDATGRSMIQGRIPGGETREILNVSRLASGVYMLIMNDENNRRVEKIVVR